MFEPVARLDEGIHAYTISKQVNSIATTTQSPLKAHHKPTLVTDFDIPLLRGGQRLVQEWLKLWTPKFAQRQAQDMREIFNAETGHC